MRVFRVFGLLAIVAIAASVMVLAPVGSRPSAAQGAEPAVVNSTADTISGNGDSDCTLREAIFAVNGASQNGDCAPSATTIMFDLAPGSIITLTAPLPEITAGNLTIEGRSGGERIIVSGANQFRVFTINTSGTVTLDGLEIRNGSANAGGDGNRGGGVFVNSGHVVIRDSLITGNVAAGGGGGIFVNGAQLTLDSSTVANNNATFDGGGIHHRSTSGTTGLIVNSTISGNGSMRGGGVHNAGSDLTVLFSTITNNTAPTGSGIQTVDGASAIVNVGASIVAQNNTGTDLHSASTGHFATGCYNVIGTTANVDAFTSSANGGCDEDSTDLLLDPLNEAGVHQLRIGDTGFNSAGRGVDLVDDSPPLGLFGATQPAVDQLGQDESGNRNDAGAYENQLPASPQALTYQAALGFPLVVDEAGGVISASGASDIEADVLLADLFDIPAGNGNAAVNGDGSFIYNPPGTAGTKTFTVVITDRPDALSIAGVTVEVVAPACSLGVSYTLNNAFSQPECDALVDLFAQDDGSGWANNDGWIDITAGVETDPCDWFGVTCTGGEITEITLFENDLEGTIPSTINALTSLEVLDLRSLEETGSIPSSSKNVITGTIPNLDGLNNLQVLDLSDNELSGPIPNLDNLTNLQTLDLRLNSLTGPIPNLTNATGLVDLLLQNNQLAGPLPSLDGLTSLKHVDLSNNQIDGSLPNLDSLTSLKILDIRSNQLSGVLPDLDQLTSLTTLDLDNNQLTGPIPSIDTLANLTTLRLSDNQLTGPLPSFDGLASLTELQLARNALTEPLPSFDNLTNLTTLLASDNQLTGPVPSLDNLTNLTALDLANNQLTGPIPSLDNLTNLTDLDLANNQLTGPVPGLPLSPNASDATPIRVLYLNDNQLAGLMPTSVELMNVHLFVFLDLETNGCLTAAESTRLFLESRNAAAALNRGCEPVADTASVPAQSSVLIDVLANDPMHLTAFPDLTIEAQPATNGGQATVEGDQIRFTPAADATAGSTDTFNYQACSGEFCATAEVVVSITTGPACTIGNATMPAPGLPQSECDALHALYVSTNGASWATNMGWVKIDTGGETDPCGWHGVTCNDSKTAVTGISLHANQLGGSIPSEIAALPELEGLSLSSNQLTGEIPSLDSLVELRSLLVWGNQLTGEIPALTNLTKLQTVGASFNQLSGEIPSLATLAQLRFFDVSRNQLTGEIPPLDALTQLQTLFLAENQLTGEIPPLDTLAGLIRLTADGNQLTGEIPQLDALTELQTLTVSRNQLTGEIPQLGALTELQTLSLDRNQLAGLIPASVTSLTSLQTARLEANACLTTEQSTFDFLSSLPTNDVAQAIDTGCDAVDDSADVLSNRSVLVDVVANDPLSPSAVTALSIEADPTSGTAVVESGQVRYTPAPGSAADSDSFDYELCSGTFCTTASVSLTITPTTAPTAADDAVTTGFDTAVTVNVVDGSAGGADTDAEGDALTVTAVDGFTSGTATFAGQEITYTPEAGFVGDDTATYTITDGALTATATLTVTVEAAPITSMCFGQPATIDLNVTPGATGTAGPDVIFGTPGNDVINGLGGEDIICGEGGDDTINGGGDKDFIFGGEGNDTMFGGDGNDRIRGNQGEDVINGEEGNDFLYGGIDSDTISGGLGNDTIGGFGGADDISGGEGRDTIFGGFGADIINAGPGNDTVNGLIGNDIINGGDGNDTLNGDQGQDVIHGDAGDDTVNGGNSLDTLFGDAGDDSVNGGKANDTLSGGDGDDTCAGNKDTDTTDGTCETVFGVP